MHKFIIYKLFLYLLSDKHLVFRDSYEGLSKFDIETQTQTQIVSNTTFVSITYKKINDSSAYNVRKHDV